MSNPHAVMQKARSPLLTSFGVMYRSLFFILHIVLEAPFCLQGLFAPTALPFMDATNTTLIMIKMFSALSLGSCVTALLCYPLPEYLPGKRALAVQLILYHSLASGVLLTSPRFIPISFGNLAESAKITPESCWGAAHCLMGLAFAVWWQGTLVYAQAARQINMAGGGGQ